MPTNLPAGYAQVSLHIKHDSSPRINIISYVVQKTAAGETMSSVATASLSAWNTTNSLRSIMDSSAKLVNIHVRNGSADDETPSDDFPQSQAGSAAIQSLPPNCNCLVRKVTAMGGRHGRGRFFLPYVVATSDVDEVGFITPARVVTIQTAMNNWLAAFDTGPRFMQLFHPDVQAGGAAPPGVVIPGGPPTPIIDLRVQQLIGSQRRRLGR